MDQLLNEVIKALAGVLALGITTAGGFVVTWLRAHLKAKTWQALTTTAQQVASAAVHEAEGSTLSSAGKKDVAVKIVKAWLTSHGKTVDDQLISGWVEAAVDGMHLAWQATAQPAASTPAQLTNAGATAPAAKLTDAQLPDALAAVTAANAKATPSGPQEVEA